MYHTCMHSHTCTYTHTHACTHTHTHTHTHAYTHACTHTHIHTHTHICTHALTHTYTHSRMHTHTHARMLARSHALYLSGQPTLHHPGVEVRCRCLVVLSQAVADHKGCPHRQVNVRRPQRVEFNQLGLPHTPSISDKGVEAFWSDSHQLNWLQRAGPDRDSDEASWTLVL